MKLHRIKEVMKQQGVSQKELAERLGVSEPALCMQLKSEGISLQRLNEIAEALGVELIQLIVHKPSAGSIGYCPHCGKEIHIALS